MKLWIPFRLVPCHPSNYRLIPKNTLCPKHRNSLLICNSHLPRCKLWMTSPLNSCKWCIYIFPIYLFTRGTRTLLWVLYYNRNMKYRSYFIFINHSNSIYRICPSLRSNKILRSYCHYKSIFSHPIYWKILSRMNLGGLCSRQCHTKPILCFSFYLTFCYHGGHHSTHYVSSSIRIKQPNWSKCRFRSSSLPSILFH